MTSDEAQVERVIKSESFRTALGAYLMEPSEDARRNIARAALAAAPPPQEAQDALVPPPITLAVEAMERATIERAAAIVDEWTRPSALKLAAGEMTAQELRTAIAVLQGVSSRIRALVGDPREAVMIHNHRPGEPTTAEKDVLQLFREAAIEHYEDSGPENPESWRCVICAAEWETKLDEPEAHTDECPFRVLAATSNDRR